MWYCKNLLIAIDQLVNALLGGHADETLSSRAHRARLIGKPLAAEVIDWLFFFDKDHCREAFESERTGRQLPPEMRGGGQ